MRNWLIGFVLLTVLSSLGACKSGKTCRGGGWYGNRNLSFVPQTKSKVDLDCEVKDENILTDYEPVKPSR